MQPDARAGFLRVFLPGRGVRRVRLFALLAVLSLLLAGCSGNADPAGTTETSSSSTTTSTGPPPKPVVYSDALHLLELPTMVPALSSTTSEVRTPTNGSGFGGGGGQGDDGPDGWEYQITQAANISNGQVHLWIEITETLVQSPLGFPPGEQPCTWFIVLELGADNDADVPCLSEPPGPINPGTKELVFDFVSTDLFQLEANETISLRFGRAAFGPSTTPSVYVLSGSADHDSRVQLTGLREAIEG